MASQKVYSVDKIFTGEQWLTGYAIISDNNTITDLIPLKDIGSSLHVEQFPDCIITPAFIDLQIYGAYGKLLAVYPETDSLYKLNDYCRNGGAAYCLPTVATNSYEVFRKAIDAVREYWNKGGDGILGIHLEGPWIKIGRAHV